MPTHGINFALYHFPKLVLGKYYFFFKIPRKGVQCLKKINMHHYFYQQIELANDIILAIAINKYKSLIPRTTCIFWWILLDSVLLFVDSSLFCRYLKLLVSMMTSSNFPRYWPFVRGIHRSPVNSPRKGQWRGALMFSLICVWINSWVNNREAGDLRHHRAHYDVIVVQKSKLVYHDVK